MAINYGTATDMASDHADGFEARIGLASLSTSWPVSYDNGFTYELIDNSTSW